jgi:hypothetical protein
MLSFSGVATKVCKKLNTSRQVAFQDSTRDGKRQAPNIWFCAKIVENNFLISPRPSAAEHSFFITYFSR